MNALKTLFKRIKGLLIDSRYRKLFLLLAFALCCVVVYRTGRPIRKEF